MFPHAAAAGRGMKQHDGYSRAAGVPVPDANAWKIRIGLARLRRSLSEGRRGGDGEARQECREKPCTNYPALNAVHAVSLGCAAACLLAAPGNAEQTQVDRLAHGVIPRRARMNAVPAVEWRLHQVWIGRIAHHPIEVNYRIEWRLGADPLVDLVPDLGGAPRRMSLVPMNSTTSVTP